MTASAIVGWDIGGVNVKAALVVGGRLRGAISRPLEIQHRFDALGATLADAVAELGAPADTWHAVTMTAELSQRFRTKAEGVTAVLDAVEAALRPDRVRVFDVHGRFVTCVDARRDTLAVSASNWVATATLIATRTPDAVLVDIGTTTTDIIPIVGGRIAAVGRTDPDRLASGELVYTGLVRTPIEAVLRVVPYRRGQAAVSADGFAIVGDAHLWCGTLAAADYTAPTPDGRPAARLWAGERLARIVCADRTMLDDAAIDAIAAAVVEAQTATISAAIARVAGIAGVRAAVVAGLGDAIAAKAAARAGLDVVRLADTLGSAARGAPAAAVALLFAETPAGG